MRLGILTTFACALISAAPTYGQEIIDMTCRELNKNSDKTDNAVENAIGVARSTGTIGYIEGYLNAKGRTTEMAIVIENVFIFCAQNPDRLIFDEIDKYIP